MQAQRGFIFLQSVLMHLKWILQEYMYFTSIFHNDITPVILSLGHTKLRCSHKTVVLVRGRTIPLGLSAEKLKSTSEHDYSRTMVVRCRKTSHDHSTTSWEDRAHVKVQTSKMSHYITSKVEVARWFYDTLQSRASQPGFWTRPKTAKTSCYGHRWLRRRISSHDSPPMVHDHPNFTHRRWSYDV